MEEARKLKSIGSYTLCDVIGEGSFSVVRKAILTSGSNEIYACKIIPKIKFRERNLAMRFQLEIRVMQALHHPNIVQIYDIFRDKQFYYVIMEYINEGTLFDYICNQRRISENQAKDYMFQIFKAIKYIHSLGICHRDIKLENILLNNNYSNIKISDFGLSKFLGKDGLTNTPVGSPLYASPECLSGKPYDARKSDIWSCGVVMYTLLSGKMPWYGKTQSHIFSQIKKANYEMPSYLSTECKKMIRSILTNDVEKRPNAAEILNSRWFATERSKSEINLLSKPNKLLSLKILDSFFQKDMKSRICSASFERLLSAIHDNEANLLPTINLNSNKSIATKSPETATQNKIQNEKIPKPILKIKKVPSTTAFDIDFEKKLRSILFEKVDFPVSIKHRSSLPPKIKKKDKTHRSSVHKKQNKTTETQNSSLSERLPFKDDNNSNSKENSSIISTISEFKPRNRCNSHHCISFHIISSTNTSTSDNFNDDNSSNGSNANPNSQSEFNSNDSDNHNKSISNPDDNEILQDTKIKSENSDEKELIKVKKHSKYKNKKDKKEKKSKKEKKGKHSKKITELFKTSETM